MERWLILVWSFLFALLGEAQVRVSAWPEGKDGLERSPEVPFNAAGRRVTLDSP